jgi:hypothetical protein
MVLQQPSGLKVDCNWQNVLLQEALTLQSGLQQCVVPKAKPGSQLFQKPMRCLLPTNCDAKRIGAVWVFEKLCWLSFKIINDL